MSRILLSLILILAPLCQVRGQILSPILASSVAASGGGGAAVLIQTCTQNDSSGGGALITATCSSTGAGHLLVAFGLNIQSATAVTISDSASQTWSTAFSSTGCQVEEFGTAGCIFSYICNSASGMTTVTAAGAGFSSMSLIVREYSGVQTSSCLDQQSTPKGQNSTSPGSSNAITTTVTDLLIGIATGGHTQTFGVGSGWADFTSLPDTSAAQLDVAIEDILTSASGSNTAAFTNSGGNGQGIGIVSFKLP